MGASSEATPWGGPSSLLTDPLTPAEDTLPNRPAAGQRACVLELPSTGPCEHSLPRRQQPRSGWRGDVWHRPCSPVTAMPQGVRGAWVTPGSCSPGPRPPGRPPGGAAETPRKHPLGAWGPAEKLRASRGPWEATTCAALTLSGVSHALLGRTPWAQEQPLPLLHLSPSSVPYRRSLILCPLAKVRLQCHQDRPESVDLGCELVTRHQRVHLFVRLLVCSLRAAALPCHVLQAQAQTALPVRAARPLCLVHRLSHGDSRVSLLPKSCGPKWQMHSLSACAESCLQLSIPSAS